mmetsp:Transcript_30125/g.75937  ORF Transcript_30125/g.75937 Transcript_30125/m.75937 type:complete len:239 (-) Transcript_30125:137-853(-)
MTVSAEQGGTVMLRLSPPCQTTPPSASVRTTLNSEVSPVGSSSMQASVRSPIQLQVGAAPTLQLPSCGALPTSQYALRRSILSTVSTTTARMVSAILPPELPPPAEVIACGGGGGGLGRMGAAAEALLATSGTTDTASISQLHCTLTALCCRGTSARRLLPVCHMELPFGSTITHLNSTSMPAGSLTLLVQWLPSGDSRRSAAPASQAPSSGKLPMTCRLWPFCVWWNISNVTVTRSA